MKKIGIVLQCIFMFASFCYSQNRSITFETSKWQEIKDKAKKENKIIFVDCFTAWCGPCKLMAKDIFTNDTVADFYNSSFICAKFDMEKDEGIILAKTYSIIAYPTFIFIDGDGNLLHRCVGLQSTKSFIELGNDAMNPEKQFVKLEEQYIAGRRDAPFIYSYLKVLKYGGDKFKKVKNEYFKTQKESDLTTQFNWTILWQFDNDLRSREYKYVYNHKKEFAEIYTMDSVNMLIDYTLAMALIPVVFRDTTGKAFDDFIEDIKKSDVPNVEEIKLRGKMFVVSSKENWKEYADIAVVYIEKYKEDDSKELNEVAWNFYEKINDQALLEKALNWAKKSVELKTGYANLDTYACLLFKLGKKEEAVKIEEQALKLLKETGKSTTEYEKKIEEFKK